MTAMTAVTACMTAYLKPGYDWRHEDSQRSRALSMASEWPVAAGSKERTSSKLDREHNLVLEFIFLVVWK